MSLHIGTDKYPDLMLVLPFSPLRVPLLFNANLMIYQYHKGSQMTSTIVVRNFRTEQIVGEWKVPEQPTIYTVVCPRLDGFQKASFLSSFIFSNYYAFNKNGLYRIIWLYTWSLVVGSLWERLGDVSIEEMYH